jgi:2-C-methyl-D-erythritol 2,4-cyclodiphosphate synthase
MELWSRLTSEARKAFVHAHKEAERRHVQLIGTDYLLLGILMVDDGVGVQVLQMLAPDLQALRLELERGMESAEAEASSEEATFTREAREVLTLAWDEAHETGLSSVGTEHLLLGLLRVESGPAYELLRLRGVKVEAARDFASRLRGDEESVQKMVRVGNPPPVPLPVKATRTGIGYDSHRLVEGRKLVLGGVEIEWEKGLLGHSDGDVVLHAIADALLGACGLGDIGMHFPDTDERYKDADSGKLLQVAAEMARAKGWEPVNVDVSILAEAPKIGPHRDAMRTAIAEAMGIAEGCVNVKATTNEGMGFVGRGEGIAAMAVVSVAAVPDSA